MTDEKPKTELTTAQAGMINALIDARTVAAAARKVGISRATYYRWIDEDPLFRAEVQAARRRFAEEGLELLVAGMEKAVRRIMEALDDKDPSIRLRAGIEAARLALDLRRTLGIENRLDELEERARLLRRQNAPPL